MRIGLTNGSRRPFCPIGRGFFSAAGAAATSVAFVAGVFAGVDGLVTTNGVTGFVVTPFLVDGVGLALATAFAGTEDDVVLPAVFPLAGVGVAFAVAEVLFPVVEPPLVWIVPVVTAGLVAPVAPVLLLEVGLPPVVVLPPVDFAAEAPFVLAAPVFAVVDAGVVVFTAFAGVLLGVAWALAALDGVGLVVDVPFLLADAGVGVGVGDAF